MISTREFFKTGKFRSRKQKSPQDLAISSYPSRNASIVTTNTNSTSWTAPLKYTRIMRRKPPPPPLQGNLPSTDPDSFSQSTRELDDTMREATNVIPPFQGLPSTRLISPGLLGDDEYRALGLHTSDTKRTHAFQNGSQHILSKLSSEESTVHETFEMDVPPHTSRANRPDLQVRIPANTPPLRSPNLLSARNGGPTPPSAISSSSSLPTGRNPRSATTATPYSMVSPLTGVEQQNSRRPFSAESTKVITKYNSPTPQQRIDERYQRSERSRRGSISDNFEIETPRPGETPVLGNATQLRFDSTNLYHAALIPAAIKTRKFVNTNPLTIHRKGSSVSVMSNADVNKPLPPEPPGGPTRSETSPAPLRHIAYSSCPSPSRSQHQIPSRSNSIIKRNNRSPQLLSEPSSPETMKFASANVTRRSSQSSMTRATALRSKYTPKDLDSMDEAVQRRINGNSAYQTPTRSRNPTPPNQSQISLIDQNYLHTITENSPRTSHALSVMDEPLQISRGPMKMEPSRRAPQPPAQPLRVHAIEVDKAGKITSTISRTQSSNSMNTLHKVDTDKQGKRQLAVPRTKSSNSINSVQEPLRKRAMPVAHSSPELKNHEYTSTEQNGIDGRTSEWPSAEKSQKERKNIDRMNAERVSKADRVLGLDRTSAMSRSVYEARPQTQESVRLAEQQSTEDFHEVRGKQDAHFEEIEDRLRLLRAKEDPAVVFTAFHQNDSYSQGKKQEKLRSYEPIQSENKATIEEKLHLSGTLRGNPIVPMFIAELEANPASSSVELNRSDVTKSTCSIVHEEGRKIGMAELLLPSPNTLATIPIPPEPIDQSHRRGRLTGSIPQSSISGKTKSILSTRSVRVRSLASIAASDIPDFYANAPTQGTYSKRPSMTDSEYEDVISADAAEQVLLHILKGLDNLEDLFAAALVSKGFYRTFKRHELFLLKHAIWKMSPAAWELREMSIPYGELDSGLKDYTPALYFRYYVQDLLTMVELKAMILESCKSFLRPETISGLAGETERSAMIDEAFWRVWTFCKIFGCYTQRDEDIVGQMDWLKGGVIAGQSSDTRTLALTDELARNSVLFNPPNGFARGNGKQGLSAEELYDMIEIWTCLGVLVRGYHGKRNEAREYGVYDRCNVTLGDIISENAMLEEWTHHLLTLAPSTVLDVTSLATPTRKQFAQARSQGYTKWVPPKRGMSRSTFLKEAASRVYEDKMAQNRPANGYSRMYSTLPFVHPSISADAAIAAKARIAQHAAEIRKLKEDPNYQNVPVSDDRPLSKYSDVLDRLEAISAATHAPPMPKLPGLAARLSRAKSRGDAAILTASIVRPSSPTSTVKSSAVSSKYSVSTGQGNISTAEINPLTGSMKPGASKIKHPFHRKPSEDSVSHSPSKGAGGRFSTLRGHKLLERAKSKKDKKRSAESIARPALPTLIPPSDEKFAVLSEEQVSSRIPVPAHPQVRDPVDLAVEKLVLMGFEEGKAKKVLAQTETGNGINFETALSKLKKEMERRKRLERLETMG